MANLSALGYETITITDYYNWTLGRITLPKKPFIITFDDAANDIYDNATASMDAFGFVGVLPVPTLNPDYLGGTMTWAEIIELDGKGWEIVSHSNNHVSFKGMTESAMISNLTESKQAIINNISKTPIAFVYPNNYMNSTINDLCSNYYTICVGNGTGNIDSNYDGSRGNPFWHKGDNLTHNGLLRTQLNRTTTWEELIAVIEPKEELIIDYNLNENSGTTAYDVSGNGNNGIIDGATWNNDGVDVALTKDTDYSLAGSTFMIINDDYQWTGINSSWDYKDNVIEGTFDIVDGMKDWIGVIIIMLMIPLFLVFNKLKGRTI